MTGEGQPGFLFNTGPDGRCDDAKVGGAMMRWNPALEKFCIWYYGRSQDFPAGLAPALGTGDITLEGGLWHHWYYGGDTGNPAPGDPIYGFPGYRLYPGLAISEDGISWQRRPGNAPRGALVGLGGEIYGAFPNVYRLGNRTILQLTLKDRDFKGWITRVWQSEDLENWTLLGPLTWSDDPRAYDGGGMITRQVLHNIPGAGAEWMMIYTAVDGRAAMNQQRTIAVAISDDGLTWRHQFDGPVFTASSPGAWDDYNVANPQICVRGDELWMTYFGFADPQGPNAAQRGVGLAVSKSGDLRSFERITL